MLNIGPFRLALSFLFPDKYGSCFWHLKLIILINVKKFCFDLLQKLLPLFVDVAQLLSSRTSGPGVLKFHIHVS